MRVIHAIKLSKWYKQHPFFLLKEVDDANEKLEQSFDADMEDMGRTAAKGIYHHYREPTVHLSGKKWKK